MTGDVINKHTIEHFSHSSRPFNQRDVNELAILGDDASPQIVTRTPYEMGSNVRMIYCGQSEAIKNLKINKEVLSAVACHGMAKSKLLCFIIQLSQLLRIVCWFLLSSQVQNAHFHMTCCLQCLLGCEFKRRTCCCGAFTSIAWSSGGGRWRRWTINKIPSQSSKI